jgi:hypothetical protein
METLIHKIECLPSNIDGLGFPILSPRLYRTCSFGLPDSDTIQGVIFHLNMKCYVEDAIEIHPGQIAVKTRISDTYSTLLLDKLFREGAHTMSGKIWKVSKYKHLMTSVTADYILYNNMSQCHMTDFLEDPDDKSCVVFIIEMLTH